MPLGGAAAQYGQRSTLKDQKGVDDELGCIS